MGTFKPERKRLSAVEKKATRIDRRSRKTRAELGRLLDFLELSEDMTWDQYCKLHPLSRKYD